MNSLLARLLLCFPLLLFCAATNGQSKTPGIIHVKPVGVCMRKTTMLVFPAAISDADRGSGDIIIKTAKKTSNILKVKAARAGFAPTNLSVVTTDGKLYSIDIRFDSTPASLAYSIGADERVQTPVQFEGGFSPSLLDSLAGLVARTKPITHHPNVWAFRMTLGLRGIFYHNGLLIFLFRLSNSSDIPFDISFARFYERDKHKSKRTSLMEKELIPRLVHYTAGPVIGGKSTNTLVVIFDKFTIADDKYFSAELYEQGGDRQLRCRIKGKHLLKARPFQSPLLNGNTF